MGVICSYSTSFCIARFKLCFIAEEIEEKLNADEKAQKAAIEKERAAGKGEPRDDGKPAQSIAVEKKDENKKCEVCGEKTADEPHKHTSDSASAMQTVWKECQDSSRSVEITYHSEDGAEILTKVYFPHNKKVGVNPIKLGCELRIFWIEWTERWVSGEGEVEH